MTKAHKWSLVVTLLCGAAVFAKLREPLMAAAQLWAAAVLAALRTDD